MQIIGPASSAESRLVPGSSYSLGIIGGVTWNISRLWSGYSIEKSLVRSTDAPFGLPEKLPPPVRKRRIPEKVAKLPIPGGWVRRL